MPGFVDVSNMSDLEIKRLGQRDDDDFAISSRRRSQAQPRVAYSVNDVWAAASAAQRVNCSYVKVTVYGPEGNNGIKIVQQRNRDVMMNFLANPDTITAEDRAEGERVREFLRQDLSFRALKGKLTEFDSATSKCLAVEDQFDSAKHRYELAIVACLPNSARRQEQRQTADSRLQFATGGFVGQPGQKVMLNIEVVSAVYSQNYNVFFIRGITDQDQAVMFSNKERFDAGESLTIQGKVKAHRDNLTQLNYVKVL